MARTISKPGPPPTSCHTCRRRRKKCDLSRPHCKRCLRGGYECLGYADSKTRAGAHQEDAGASVPQARSIPAIPAGPVRSEASGSTAVDSTAGEQLNPARINANHNLGRSVLGAALLYRMREMGANDDQASIDSSEEFDRSWPQEQGRLAPYSRSQTRWSSGAKRSFDSSFEARTTEGELCRAIEALCQSLPPSVDVTQIMKEHQTLHIIRQYYLQRVRAWFRTPPDPVRDSLAIRFKKSKVIVWTMHLGTKLFETLNQDPCHRVSRGCIGWIDNVEQNVSMSSRNNSPVNNIADCLTIQLELAFLKFGLVDTVSGYISLQKALPRFLQLVAAFPNLYTEHPNGNLVVSFAGTLSATPHEFQRFVMYDTIAALVLGVDPLVEYGYDGGRISSSYIFEWVHGVPVALVEVISQVSSWRAGSRVPLDDWQTLEARVLAWQPPFSPSSEEGIDMPRFAVQESWRHVVLIYLYMGICGASSHDARVKTSVDRIFQLGETVANLPIGTHMFTPCIVAGLAARLEKHRVLIHQMLLSYTGTRAWLFRGPQFSQVLYHLWHGVGIGGAPVTWDDYVQSRCAVMPI